MPHFKRTPSRRPWLTRVSSLGITQSEMRMTMKCFIGLLLFYGVCLSLCAAEAKSKPNVLMISLDDLNDWIEPWKSVV